MLVRTTLVAFALLAAGCSSTDGPSTSSLPLRPGLAVVEANGTVDQATARLDVALDDAEGVRVVAEVNHTSNAASVSQSLRPTRVRLFGNPTLGSPLIQSNQLAGLDLPQKMLVFQDEDERTLVAYNTTDYLAARYGFAGQPALAQLAPALDGLAQAASASGVQTEALSAEGVTLQEGIVTLASDANAGTTYDRLRSAIVSNPNLTIVAEVDHQLNASRAGFTLRETRLIIFGNPRLGTPLMRVSPTIGIDLPQSMLIYQPASGPAQIAYEDPGFLAERHGIPETTAQIEQIRAALSDLAAGAATLLGTPAPTP